MNEARAARPKRARLALGAACLAFIGLANGPAIWNSRASGSREETFPDYAGPGEIIAHGLRARAGSVSARMPLASLSVAALDYRIAPRAGRLFAADLALLVLLILALGLLLQPWGELLAGLTIVVPFMGPGYFLAPDSGYALLVLLTAGLLVWRARAPSPSRSAWLATAVGAGLLWRSPLALFTPALALYEWSVEHRFSFKAYRKQFLILCLVPYLFLLPWVVMNWTIHRRLALFEQGAAGSNIITGALGLVGTVEGDLHAIADAPVDRENTGQVLGWAIREVARHPLRYARAYVRRAGYALSPHPWVALFALAGFWAFRRRREYRELALLAAYFLGLHCFMTVEPRYFWPLWPLLGLLAWSGAMRPFARGRPADDSPGPLFASRLLKAALLCVLALALGTDWKILSFSNFPRRARSAEEEFDDALRSNPDDVWLLGERGELRLGRSDFAGALQDFSRAAALRPADSGLRLNQARAEAFSGKPARLLAWDDPDSRIDIQVDADILKAGAYLRSGRKDAARERLAAAREKSRASDVTVRGPRGALEKRALGRLIASDAQFFERVRELRGPETIAEDIRWDKLLIAANPDSGEVWEIWADMAERSAKPGLSGQALEFSAQAEKRGLDSQAKRSRLLLLHEELAGLLIESAELAAKRGERAQALEFSAQAEKCGLDTEEKRRRLLQVSLELKDYPRAAALLDALSRSRPDDAGLWIESAELAAKSGKRAQALGFSARAETLGLDDEEKRRRLLRLYDELKEYGRAAALLDALSRSHPNDSELLIESAELAAESGRRAQALDLMARAEKLQALAPDRDGARGQRLALAYQDLKEYPHALALFAGLTRQHPDVASFLSDQAVCESIMGRDDAALADLRAALRLDPKFLPAALSLSALLEEKGRFQEALRVCDEALSRAAAPDADPLRPALAAARRELLARITR